MVVKPLNGKWLKQRHIDGRSSHEQGDACEHIQGNHRFTIYAAKLVRRSADRVIFSFHRFPKLSLENKQERGTSWIPHRVEQAENLTRGGGLSLAAEGCSEAMEATHNVRPIRIGGSRPVALTVMGDATATFM